MTNLSKKMMQTTRKGGSMNRIRGGATVLGLALLMASSAAYAQEITGRVTGRVADQDTGAPLGGVTVIVQGPQGEDATITDDKGQYLFTSLGVGTYTIRFYLANTSTQVEQPGVVVSAEKTVRVNAKIASTAQAAAQQTYVITGKAPSIDIGSARIGATFDEDFTLKLPNGRTYGDVIAKAPGVFVDPSGNVSIGGATGLENIYVVNGMNVTGVEFGNLESGAASSGGGTNLPLEFLTQIDVNSGGYNAEFGGAMGGVINTVLKSGSNQFHGSVFSYWSPYWLTAEPNMVTKVGGSVASQRKPDYSTDLGVEVGGPIIKDKLFFWAGFAPSLTDSHVFRLIYAQQEDPMNMGMPLTDAAGNRVLTELRDQRARIDESHRIWNYGATLDYTPRAEHHLTLAILGTPNITKGMRSVATFDPANANPAWSAEKLTKTNTDVTAHWVSKLMDRHWQIDALVGMHREDLNDRSPNAALNNLNQLEYWGANLWDLEGLPGCEPTAGGFQPCPVDFYHTGGFGLTRQYKGQRFSAELKSTHLFEGGGHHELKYGWHNELAYFDQDRYYSGTLGNRALAILAPNGGNPTGLPDPYNNTYSFFTLQPGESPVDYQGMKPPTNLLYAPQYQDDLKANVRSVSNAFFLQDSYNPEGLRNLTLNAGVRFEMQKMFDTHDKAFLDTNNLAPRFGAIYDPMNDGRSKISASYGRYFEAVPLNIAARYFGGEGILLRNGVPLADCAKPNAYDWTGDGEWKKCMTPALDSAMDNAAGGSQTANNGTNYPLQSKLKGQYHNEIVGTVERELKEDLTARIDYVHRWLGTIIEDGAGDASLFAVLANPGDVPQGAIDDAQKDVDRLKKLDQMDPVVQSALGNAEAKLGALKALQGVPKPERTYDAISLSLNKRFSKNWQARASYTYSRLVGTYEGLYQAEQNYFAPNGSNSYDVPDLNVNHRGRLPNDRPHLARLNGSYSHEVGTGQITAGLSFFAQSGMPRNYMSGVVPGQQINYLLPRGSAGRTPWTTQFDARLSYGRPLSPTVSLEAFLNLFNLFNQQTAQLEDDNYTFAWAGPVVNGTAKDLKFAKDIFGNSVESQKNPNFGRPTQYQLPFHGQMGLRLTF
jgi:Carboxypeptidase regulatory-like domain/TonB-dependent Receptor Plug Domain